ncbi:MAG TPA: SPASM domain-containing protein, partial [Treponemataceae bacterium]|nr:SPASM domain-containing protein [Treponemataceae bacterium]
MHVSLQSLEQFPLEEQKERLEKIIASVQHLISHNKELLVNLRLWTGDQEEFTARMGAYLEKIFGMDEGAVMKKLLPTKGIMLDPGIALHLARTFDWPDLSLPSSGEKGFCMALRDQAGILCDGTVIPCCLDRNGKINLGNILSEMSWDEIMNSPRAKNLYEGFSQRKAGEELCRHCSYRKRFG